MFAHSPATSRALILRATRVSSISMNGETQCAAIPLKITRSALADFSLNQLDHPLASNPTKMPRIHGFYG
jgi:hypothetical protein